MNEIIKPERPKVHLYKDDQPVPVGELPITDKPTPVIQKSELPVRPERPKIVYVKEYSLI